jgi:hypothetical protein
MRRRQVPLWASMMNARAKESFAKPSGSGAWLMALDSFYELRHWSRPFFVPDVRAFKGHAAFRRVPERREF